MSSCRTRPDVALAVSSVVALCLAGTSVPGHAQSSYALATLRSTNSLGVTPLRLDAQNNALGSAYYYTGIGFPIFGTPSVPLFGGLALLYQPAITTWVAGTSTTVSPRRLAADGFAMTAASPDGHLVMSSVGLYTVSGNSAKLQSSSRFDTVGSTPVTQGFGSVGARSLSNAGTVASTVTVNGVLDDTAQRAVVWEGTSLVGRFLPFDTYAYSYTQGISAAGVVAGGVAEAKPGFVRAAVWDNTGALKVLDRQAGRGSSAVQANDAGQVLVCVADATTSSTTNSDGVTFVNTRYSRLRPVVFSQGQEREVQPLVAGQAVTAWAMNASGTVVGRSGAYVPLPYGQAETPRTCINTAATAGRAIIWQNGVTTDLNTWGAGKGVKLPSGSVLVDAYDINDQGSILAVLRASNGTTTTVRLTAKP